MLNQTHPHTSTDRSHGIAVSGRPQLFLDDYLIAETANLIRRVDQPVKHPSNPLMKADTPWEKRFLGYGTTLYDEHRHRFRLWYLAQEHPRQVLPDQPGISKLGNYYICYAESEDGLNWVRPAVGQMPLGEHTQHNMVIPGGHGVCVLHTPDDPDPNQQYKAAGGGIYAFSPDGIQWDVHDWIPAVGKNDTCTSVVRWKGQYMAFVRNQEDDPDWPGVMRGIGISVSDDFVHWSSKQSIFTSDERDGYPWHQPHALCVTAYGDVLIGLLSMCHIIPEAGNNLTGDMDVQLMVSRDGRSWHRVADRAVFMPQETAGPIGARPWDLRFHVHSNFFVKDDQIHLYYYGSAVRWGEGAWLKGRQAFGNLENRIGSAEEIFGDSGNAVGLATLSADRFVALRPQNWVEKGQLQTHPLYWDGSQLLINADLRHGGLQVELINRCGDVLPGYGREQSYLVPHDGLRHRVVWRDNERILNLPQTSGKEPIMIRMILTNGYLYAFQVVKTEKAPRDL